MVAIIIKKIIARLWLSIIVAQYPYFFLSVGTRSEKIKTNSAVKLPSKLKSLELKLNIELKNRFTKGIVSPAPIEIRINGEIALNIKFQS